ncbi:hypothetical protein J2W42_003539 [Rhizobium tibeticum]|nr:hypothetical protein [Rhizobium tibeticum]
MLPPYARRTRGDRAGNVVSGNSAAATIRNSVNMHAIDGHEFSMRFLEPLRLRFCPPRRSGRAFGRYPSPVQAFGRGIWSLKQIRVNVILKLVDCYLLSGDADSRISCTAGATRGWPPSSAQQLFPLEVKTFIPMGLGFRWPIFLVRLKARCGVTAQRRSSNNRCNIFELISIGLPTLRLLF